MTEPPPRINVTDASYDQEYVRELFNRMGRTYDTVNFVSSFGFSHLWRRQCVDLTAIHPGDTVCDLMSGGGECWSALLPRAASIVSIDFSQVMIERQKHINSKKGYSIDIRCENALAMSLPNASVDAVVCAFGLKTLDTRGVLTLATEVNRVLKPGGRYAFLEISTAKDWWLGSLYLWYLSSMIPVIGKLCLGDLECYRMLGRYTRSFGSCEKIIGAFEQARLSVKFRKHFFGCATSISGTKLA